MRQFPLRKLKPHRKQYSHRKTLGIAPIPLPGTVTNLKYFITDQGTTNECTAYTAKEIRQTKKGWDYDAHNFFAGELSIGADPASGATIETQGAAGIKIGWTKEGDSEPSDKATYYLFVNPPLIGGPDMFDTLRATIVEQGPLSGGLTWYNEWTQAPGGIIPHEGKTILGGHAVTLANLVCKNGIDYIAISVHWGPNYGDGGLYYLDRYMCNRVFRNFGVIYWVDTPDLRITKMGLIEALLVNIKNLLSKLNPLGFAMIKR